MARREKKFAMLSARRHDSGKFGASLSRVLHRFGGEIPSVSSVPAPVAPRKPVLCLLSNSAKSGIKSFIKDGEICGEAENGKTAIEMVTDRQPDLVVLDLSMPVM